MKKIILLIIGLATACNSSQKTVADSESTNRVEANPEVFAMTITEEDLKEHLYTYASDEYEGRETGQPGQKKAIEYLKSEYEKLGIPAAQDNGDYFQKVPLELKKAPIGTLMVNDKVYPIGEHFLTFSQKTGAFDEVIYVGYGIEEGNYSDYGNIDVKNKIILVKAGEPKHQDGTFVLSGNNKKSAWSSMSEAPNKKADLAKVKGAKAMLYADEGNFKKYKSYYSYMKKNDNGRMDIKAPNDESMAMLFIDSEITEALLPEIENEHKAVALQTKINLNLTSPDNEVNSENVVAILKGSEKPEEYVVVSAHLDHIGVTADGEINNGADDDGSGSVALLEIAEAFKEAVNAGNGPKRSIVFLHVTGEEKGLLGSRYYTDFDPIFPLDQTVANLNIDMIGRIDPKRDGDRNYIYLIGSDKLSTELHEVSEEINKEYANLVLDYTYNDENDPNRFYYRSDHYNFAKNNVPIIFYFSGTHEDYHRPSDTPDKINYDLLRTRTQLIFHTAWELANRDKKIIVDKASK